MKFNHYYGRVLETHTENKLPQENGLDTGSLLAVFVLILWPFL